MSYTTITAKILELLGQISGIERLYAYNPNELGGYPAVTVVAQGHKNRFGSIGVNGSNIRSYQYLIRVYYTLSDDEDAEGIVQDITDKIVEKLESNVVVSGIWEKALPTEAVYRTGEREVPVLAAEITAVFEKRVNR